MKLLLLQGALRILSEPKLDASSYCLTVYICVIPTNLGRVLKLRHLLVSSTFEIVTRIG